MAETGRAVQRAGVARSLLAAGTLSVLGAVAGLPAAPVAAQDGPLGCEATVWDPAGVLGAERSEVVAATQELGRLGIDARVRVEARVDGDVDGRLAQLERQCPGWRVAGDRPPDRVVVLVVPEARSTGIWYGRDLAPLLAERWEQIQTDQMNPAFRRGAFADGLVAGLRAIPFDSPVPGVPVVDGTVDDLDAALPRTPSEPSDLPFVLFIVVFAIAVVVQVVRALTGRGGGGGRSDSSSSSWWSSGGGSVGGSSFGSGWSDSSSGGFGSSGSSGSDGGSSGGGSTSW